MEESTENEKLKKLSQLRNKLESIEICLETDIKNMEQQKKRVMKY
ncbi:Uncharacterised protein [uncultured archaeon]|nr:Uncharacterised protein [uncultured archaeon]